MAIQPTQNLRADDVGGRVVVSTRSYADAADAIDRLADHGFRVERATSSRAGSAWSSTSAAGARSARRRKER